MELVYILKDEQSALFHRFAPALGDSLQSNITERVFESIGLLFTILRIQSRFTKVQLHLGLVDDLDTVLERIEMAFEFLDILLSYIRSGSAMCSVTQWGRVQDSTILSAIER
jgi:hypothetical protein